MQGFLRNVRVGAVCAMGLALLSPLAAQPFVDQQAVEGSANVYNLDRDAHVGGIEIRGRIGKAVANEAAKPIRSIRPDVDELTVFLSSPGGDVLAAMELGEEIRKQWASTTVDQHGECFGACVLVLAAGVRRVQSQGEDVAARREPGCRQLARRSLVVVHEYRGVVARVCSATHFFVRSAPRPG